MSDIFLIQKSTLTNTANAIRNRISDKSEISPADFPGKIDDVYTAGLNSGSGSIKLEANKEVTPTTQEQSVLPTDGYNGLSKVTVKAVPTTNRAVPSIEISANGKITAKAVQTTGWVTEGTESKEYQLSSADNTDFIAENIRSGKTIFGVEGSLVEGEVLPEFDEVDDFELDISGLDTELEVSYSVSEKVTLPAGHHLLTSIEDTNFTPSNIKKGVNIFGLDGEYEGEGGEDIPDYADTDFTLHCSSREGAIDVVYSSTEKAAFDAAADGKIIDSFVDTHFLPQNIKKGTSIFGLEGEYEGDGTIETWDGTGITTTDTVPTITFYIGNGSSAPMAFKAEEGMTWYAWCLSNYNTVGATCEGEGDGSDVYIGNEQVWGANGSAISGGSTITSGAEFIYI